MENLGLVSHRYVIHYVLLLDNLLDCGLDCGVIYIDTEGTFRPERVEQIARARGLDHIQVFQYARSTIVHI